MSSPQETPKERPHLADEARNLVSKIVQLHFGTLTKRQVLGVVTGWLEDKLGYRKKTIIRCLRIDSSKELNQRNTTLLEKICYALGRYISEISKQSIEPVNSTINEVSELIDTLLEYDRYDCRLNIITRLSRELGVTNKDINRLFKEPNPYRIPSSTREELKERVLKTLKKLTAEPAKKVIVNVLPFIIKRPENTDVSVSGSQFLKRKPEDTEVEGTPLPPTGKRRFDNEGTLRVDGRTFPTHTSLEDIPFPSNKTENFRWGSKLLKRSWEEIVERFEMDSDDEVPDDSPAPWYVLSF